MKAEEDLSQEKSDAPPQEQGKLRRRIILLSLFFMLAISALLWTRYSQVGKHDLQDTPLPVPQVTLQGNPVVAFDPFLIPLGEKSKYTFISLSFSMELPNGQSGKDIKEKMTELRGLLYDTLKEDFQKSEGIPLIQAVKDGIDRALHRALPGQRVKDVFISQFLAL